MHEVLHVAVLFTTIAGAAGLALLVLWPVLADEPLPRAGWWALAGLIALAATLFLVEWGLVH